MSNTTTMQDNAIAQARKMLYVPYIEKPTYCQTLKPKVNSRCKLRFKF